MVRLHPVALRSTMTEPEPELSEEVREDAEQLYEDLEEMREAVDMLQPKVGELLTGDISIGQYELWLDENIETLEALAL